MKNEDSVYVDTDTSLLVLAFSPSLRNYYDL